MQELRKNLKENVHFTLIEGRKWQWRLQKKNEHNLSKERKPSEKTTGTIELEEVKTFIEQIKNNKAVNTRDESLKQNPILRDGYPTKNNETMICNTMLRSKLTYDTETSVSKMGRIPNEEINRRMEGENGILNYIEEKRLT